MFEVRLVESWVSLGDSGYSFGTLFEAMAEDFVENVRGLAPIIVRGDRAFSSDYVREEHVPTRWVDTERCRRVGDWLVDVTDMMLHAAYRHVGRRPSLQIDAARLERNHESIKSVVRKVERVYAVTAEHEHVVVAHTS